MSDLAEAVLLSRPNCTRLVDRMVEAGLLERRTDEADARVRWAAITSEGRRRLRRAAPTHLAGIQFHFGRHLDEETAATVGAALARLR
jgi:DNA-binding MarR family transcriptional regulator